MVQFLACNTHAAIDGAKGQTRKYFPITAVDRTYTPLQVLCQGLQLLCILSVAGSVKP